MKTTRTRVRISVAAYTTAAVLFGSLAYWGAPAIAQDRRGPGDRSGGGAPRREGSPERDTRPTRSSDPAPQRNVEPTRRSDPAPQRNVEPTRRSDPAPQRNVEPTRRSDPAPQRNVEPTRRSDPAPQRNVEPTRRSDPAPQRNVEPTRRSDPAPRRDVSRDAQINVRPERNRAEAIFTRSGEGRRYDNGVTVRNRYYVQDVHVRHFFNDGYAYYPHYSPWYVSADVYYAPFSFYYGTCPPYVYRRYCHYGPPTIVYIEIPIYTGDNCRGYRDDDDYYLNDRLYGRDYDEVRDTARDIEDAFLDGNIDKLARLTDPSIRIAVYQKGKYSYSLDPGDYLDMTRDALRSIDTVSFDLSRIRRRSDRVYVASGKHVYRDKDGDKRTVYVSFALERVRGDWVITQVGNSPDRIQDF